MVNWRFWVGRTAAIINIAFALLGLFYLSEALLSGHRTAAPATGPVVYLAVLYCRSLINLVFLAGLIVGSVYLWRFLRAGRWICNAVLIGEIVYFAVTVVFQTISWNFGGGPGPLTRAIAATGGVGDMGISLQILTGYPVAGLVLVNLAYRKIPRGGV